MTTQQQPKARLAYLSSLIAGATPPKEFRIFKRGRNTSTKGTVLFDDESARSVMAAYRKHGVDVAIDLEHLSLDTESSSFDPDARGWAKLELRHDGSLWAVDVKWTPDGARRLKEKRQRFVSPAFGMKGGRVTYVHNIALTAVPATHYAAPLVAASNRTAGNVYGLNARQLRIARETGADLKTFARLLRQSARAR